MSNNTVHALFFGTPSGFFNGEPRLNGLFSTRELAEARLLETVLSGVSIVSARIDELTVEQPYDERDPKNYPDVIAELIKQRKIQAIKNLRTHVQGLGLREAKDAVEAVVLLDLPESVRAAAQKLIDDEQAAERAKRESSRFEPVEDWTFYTFLRDDENDIWAHNGGGNYVLLNDFDGRDPFQEERTENEIERIYGIQNRSDDRDDL